MQWIAPAERDAATSPSIGVDLVLLEPEVAEAFPTAAAVNEALRTFDAGREDVDPAGGPRGQAGAARRGD